MKQLQRGGFVMGLIVGLLAGLALALAVAMYVTKVPIPFVNKVPQRSGDRDAEEREKNRNWDPNSPLYGSNPAKSAAPSTPNPSTAASGVVAPAEPVATAPAPVAPPAVAASVLPRSSAAASAPGRSSQTSTAARDPAAILSDRAPADSADAVVSTRPRDDPFIYFVQVGAYGRPEDAEQQRARLAMLGIESRITEREQSGRTIYRVRLGPFDRRDSADAAKERLEGVSVEAALVRVQK